MERANLSGNAVTFELETKVGLSRLAVEYFISRAMNRPARAARFLTSMIFAGALAACATTDVHTTEYRRQRRGGLVHERTPRRRAQSGRTAHQSVLSEPGHRVRWRLGGDLSSPGNMGPARLSQPDLCPRGRQGRALRGLGAARALCCGAARSVQILAVAGN